MKKIIVIIGILAFSLIAIASTLSLFSSRQSPLPGFRFLPTPTPVTSAFSLSQNQISSPLEKTTIGITTEQDIKKIDGLTASGSAGTENIYTFPSVNALLPNDVRTSGGKVVYERTSTYTSDSGGFPSLSDYLKKLGKPEQTIQGNSFYGEGANSYLFPTKGAVVIGNPNTDETYEIQRFVPQSLLEYLREHGDTVKAYPEEEDAP